MGIRQQNRPDAPRPEVRETDYGAKYVKAATENEAGNVTELVGDAADEAPSVVEEAVSEENNVRKAPAKPKKKGGRQKKAAK